MIDRIANQPLNGDDTLIQNQSALSSVKATQSDSSPDKLTDLGSKIIDDAASISPAAKEKLARFDAVKPFVSQLQTSGEPVNTDKVAKFKDLLAKGDISSYLDSVLGSTTQALLNSPAGKTLTANL